MSSGRIQYLDIAKGIGIILMVMGHASFGEGFSHYIHGFHMPLFFFVSGLLFTFKADKSWGEVFMGKCRTILIPYAFFGLLTYGIWAATRGGRVTGADLLTPLQRLFWNNSHGLAISGEFWFLSAMFFASLFFDGLFRFVGKPIFRAGLLIALALFGCLFRWKFDLELPWSLLSAMVGMGFMGIGCFLRQNAERGGFARRLFQLRWYEIAILALISGVLIFVNGPVNMRRSLYSIVPLFWFDAVVMSLVIVDLSMKIENLPLNGVLDRCRNWLTGVGRDSITYLCLNSLVLHFAGGAYQKIFGRSLSLCRAAVIFAVAMAVIYWIDKVMMNTNARVLLGRRPLKSGTERPRTDAGTENHRGNN
ncbi:MAG: acyltransferase family protein [Lentisphaeria bacterium]|nr:acyltransferase family protein [Lentisphaeria bacterium]